MVLDVHDAILDEKDHLHREDKVRVNGFKPAENEATSKCRGTQGSRKSLKSVVLLLWLYGNLYESREKSAPKILKKAIEPLMKNNLVLDSKGVQAGQGRYKNNFLCLEISDEDL